MPTEKAIIIGFNDMDDGEDAYLASIEAEDYTNLAGMFKTALKLLTKNDHVCITDLETYDRLGETGYRSYLPYSISMTAGHYTKSPID